jgi:hypothetical protein
MPDRPSTSRPYHSSLSMEEIRDRLEGLEFREHALSQMAERGLHARHVQEALRSEEAEIIEEYPGHFYGPCCLILGWWGERQPLHVVLATSHPLKVISTWDPSADPKNRWEADFKTRRSPGGGQR